VVGVRILYFSFGFVTLTDETDMKKALSLSGTSLKGSDISIEVSKRSNRGKPEGSGSRGGFTTPRGGGYQGGQGRGKFNYRVQLNRLSYKLVVLYVNVC